MRILYLTDNTSVHNGRFLEKITSAGHELWSWNLTAAGPSNGDLTGTALNGARHTITSSKRVNRNASPDEFRELLPQLRSVVRQIAPTLIHAGPVPTAGYLAALADFHTLLVMSWGSDLLVEAERNSEWKQASELALQKADAFFCDCDTVREKANSIRSFPDSQIVQFPWGVKQGVFSPDGPLPPPENFIPRAGTTTFIYTRSYEPLYGTDVLLDGFRRAYAADPSLRLLLLGSGSKSESICSYVQNHNLTDAVLQVGAQPESDLPMWFRASDAYISCAKSDGTSISLLEAMATGLPVIVTDIPSNREWVKEGQNGWLAAAGSAEAVARKMLQAAKLKPEERKTISENNRRVVAERADWDKNFPRLLQMYAWIAGAGVNEFTKK